MGIIIEWEKIMDKNKLLQIKKRLLALGLAGVMMGTTGCTNNENGEPKRFAISQDYYNFDEYYKYAIQNGEAVKLYNSHNVFLLYDKEMYEVEEYIYQDHITAFGGVELYDLETEEMLVYSNGIATTYNERFYNYLRENNYLVWLEEVSDYVEGHNVKDYYTLEEIKELEPLVRESLKIINEAKTKIKK